ncbi:MAG TPA: hypothetical protein VM537_01640 [Anaerolineae bacterium]|nr:hypothetical protein [Anaerolineae bacterium]
MEIDPKNAVQWVVAWRWDDGVVWPLGYTMRQTRAYAISAFEKANHEDYRKLRKAGMAIAVKVRLELVP